ncbi:MAG: hypothetical protein QG599_1163 [Pseudomonadota bacterium]|nr:hypothetical protein [Pseudomonadota bacterium]
MKISYAPLIVLCLGLGACMSQIPMATTYPISFQKKMQAAHHWDVLTEDVANRLQGALIGSGEQGRAVSLYVQQPKYNSDFGEAFHNLLITHLMERGFSLTENPASGLPLIYDVQVVSHKDRGFIRPMPGLFTALAGSVFVLHNIAHESSTAAWMAGAVGMDVATGYITDNPNNEIIVTTSVMSGDRYVARLRDIYYISDNNVGQYLASGPAPVTTRIVEVVGP